MRTFAFEGQHGIDHMFDNARAGDLPVLGHVADEDDRRAGFFGKPDERLRRYRAPGSPCRERFDRTGPHGLDEIDDDQRGVLPSERVAMMSSTDGFRGELDGPVS